MVVGQQGDDGAADGALTGAALAQGDKLRMGVGQHQPGAGGAGGKIAADPDPAQHFDHQGAGDLTGVVAAHAVGHGPDAQVGPREHRILVHLAPAADMGAGDAFKFHGLDSPQTCPTPRQ